MNTRIFWTVLLIGIVLVVLQGVLSWFDGYLTQAQMHSHNVMKGWSFMQHGGMWADVFIISPLVAYAASKYQFEVFSWRALLALLGSLATVLALVEVYRRGAIITPEAHTHDGRTTPAGWIHALFALAAIWVCVQIYLGWTNPMVTKWDIVVFSLILTPFFYLGIVKFSQHWTFETGAQIQVGAGVAAVWVVASFHLWLRN